MRTTVTLLLSASLTLSYAASSSAQSGVDPTTKATARQLGEDGMKAYDANNCPVAANLLTRAHDLVHVPTLAFYAGKCLEKMGRLADAEEMYTEAANDPVDPAAPPAVKAAHADAEKASLALAPRIAHVQITLQPPAPDAVVTLDGKPLPPAMVGVKRPIDPGSHMVQVQRAGGMTSRPFTLREGEAASVVVQLPWGVQGGVPMRPAEPMAPYPPTVVAPPTAPYAYGPPGAVYYNSAPPPVTQRRSTGLFVAGLVIAPLGALVALGGVVDLAATTAATGTTHSNNGGLLLLSVGLVATAGGIVMAVIGGKKVPVEAPPPPPPVSFEPLLGPGWAGARVRF